MDASLALYPLPDVIVVGDPSKPFEIQHQGCTVVNTVGISDLDLFENYFAVIFDLLFPNLSAGLISKIKVYLQSVRPLIQND